MDYEKERKRIIKENQKLISDFEKWLSDKNLSSITIEKHIFNVNFFLNEFLLNENATKAEDGVDEIGVFLGYWFIRKAMWANKAVIKKNATSLKKFYEFMYEEGKISKQAFSSMKESIKKRMPDWLATISRYDDPNIKDMDEVWGF